MLVSISYVKLLLYSSSRCRCCCCTTWLFLRLYLVRKNLSFSERPPPFCGQKFVIWSSNVHYNFPSIESFPSAFFTVKNRCFQWPLLMEYCLQNETKGVLWYKRFCTITGFPLGLENLENGLGRGYFPVRELWTDWKSQGKSHKETGKVREFKTNVILLIFSAI